MSYPTASLRALAGTLAVVALFASCSKHEPSGESATSAITLQRIGVSPVVVKPAEHKEFTFRGKVESIDAKARSLTVDGENVEGWMGAMTMVYRVDKDEVIDRVKVGDQITATVHGGDFQTLHDVQMVPR